MKRRRCARGDPIRPRKAGAVVGTADRHRSGRIAARERSGICAEAEALLAPVLEYFPEHEDEPEVQRSRPAERDRARRDRGSLGQFERGSHGEDRAGVRGRSTQLHLDGRGAALPAPPRADRGQIGHGVYGRGRFGSRTDLSRAQWHDDGAGAAEHRQLRRVRPDLFDDPDQL